MKLCSILALALCSSFLLTAQDLQQLADSLNVPQPTAADKKIRIPGIKGIDVKLLGADYEQIINRNGNISKPLTDTTVRVSFEVGKEGKSAISRDYEIVIPGKYGSQANVQTPYVFPALLNWKGSTGELEWPEQILVYGKSAFIPPV